MVGSLVGRRSCLEGGSVVGGSFENANYSEGLDSYLVGFGSVLLFCIVPKWFALRGH